jgi:hypothetical protein
MASPGRRHTGEYIDRDEDVQNHLGAQEEYRSTTLKALGEDVEGKVYASGE